MKFYIFMCTFYVHLDAKWNLRIIKYDEVIANANVFQRAKMAG